MSEQKQVRWLYEELPDLIKNGVLTEEVAHRLKDFYGPVEEKSKYNLALIIVGLLGTLLISGGIILIFAYNWEYLSRPWRTFFSYLPLLIAQFVYGYVFFKQKSSTAWVEASASFLMLMLAATMALISQTYHIGGTMSDFLFTWMALSIPLLYLLPSRMVGLIYLAGIASFAVESRADGHWYWGFLLVALPYLYQQVWLKRSSNGSLWLTWMLGGSFFLAYWGIVDMELALFGIFGNALILSIYYLLGNQYYHQSNNVLQSPLQNIAVIGALILALFLTYDWPRNYHFWERLFEGLNGNYRGILNLTVLIGLTLGYLSLLYFNRQQIRRLNGLLVFFPVILLAGLVLNSVGAEFWARILANIYLLLFGLYYLKEGLQSRSMRLVNQGIGIIGILIVIRFFDSDLPLMLKGIVFVLLGLGFLAANFFLAKKLKA